MDNTQEINEQYGRKKGNVQAEFTYFDGSRWSKPRYLSLREIGKITESLRKKKIPYRYRIGAVVWKSVY